VVGEAAGEPVAAPDCADVGEAPPGGEGEGERDARGEGEPPPPLDAEALPEGEGGAEGVPLRAGETIAWSLAE
jgi:hypothetical protein